MSLMDADRYLIDSSAKYENVWKGETKALGAQELAESQPAEEWERAASCHTEVLWPSATATSSARLDEEIAGQPPGRRVECSQ